LGREVEGYVYSASLPALICDSCGAAFFEPAVAAEFNLLVAEALLQAGVRSVAAVRAIRSALGLDDESLAHIFGFRREANADGERGEGRIDAETYATIHQAVLDCLKDRRERRVAAVERVLLPERRQRLSDLIEGRLKPSLRRGITPQDEGKIEEALALWREVLDERQHLLDAVAAAPKGKLIQEFVDLAALDEALVGYLRTKRGDRGLREALQRPRWVRLAVQTLMLERLLEDLVASRLTVEAFPEQHRQRIDGVAGQFQVESKRFINLIKHGSVRKHLDVRPVGIGMAAMKLMELITGASESTIRRALRKNRELRSLLDLKLVVAVTTRQS
jgi:hypothetical protein